MAAPTGFGGSRELLKLISCFFRGSGWQSNLPSSSTEMTTPASMSLMLKSEKEQDVWWRVLHSGEEAVWTRFHLPSYLSIMFSGTVLSLFLSSSHPSSSAFYFSFDVISCVSGTLGILTCCQKRTEYLRYPLQMEEPSNFHTPLKRQVTLFSEERTVTLK